jgi:hypothetical protein
VPLSTPVKIRSVTKAGDWTRLVQTPAAAGEVLDLGSIELCANDAIEATSFVINGDGFKDQLETLVTNKNDDQFSYAKYNGGSDPTNVVYVQRLSRDLSITLFFREQAVGKPDPAHVTVLIKRKVGDNQYQYYRAGAHHAGSTVTLDITRYGKVGEPVTGTFSGTFVESDNPSQRVTITHGKFAVLRHPDIR